MGKGTGWECWQTQLPGNVSETTEKHPGRNLILHSPSNHHSQSTLRPPLPPPHNHSLSHHHSSANSLNRNSLTNRRNQIHAPAPAPNDLATTPESVQLQDSWVLNSNVPLETSQRRLRMPLLTLVLLFFLILQPLGVWMYMLMTKGYFVNTVIFGGFRMPNS
ncbi:hypothetical protein TURU_147113 [Turdus rufiventris]|nr:hypothetical protein TURU_147113 [Turdus rufiventris]